MNIQVLKHGDNYIYLAVSGEVAAVIDPASAQPVLAATRDAGLSITHILVTHHHFDHTGGCAEIKHACHCEVVGPVDSGIPVLDRGVGEGDIVSAAGLDLEVMALPGHTNDHIAYYSSAGKFVFTGDVLFVAGCGRILEGTADQMWNSLQRLLALPDDTKIYCGHEYTIDNLEFALHIDPDNENIQEALVEVNDDLEKGIPSVPSTIEVEKLINPFLRAETAREFADLRRRKNVW